MSHRLQILIPESLDAAIRKAAERRRCSKGEWVRRVVLRALEDEQRQPSNPVERLASLDAPTADIEEMLNEIEAGRR
jgi:hypothetical protein